MTTNAHDPQDTITAFWNTRGQEYDAQPRHGILHPREHDAWLRALRDLLPPPPADVLDVGAGTGVLSLLIAELGHRVTGTDLAEGMLATARAKAEGMTPQPLFQVGDAIVPAFPPASFDVVANRHLLWTLLDPERAFASWYTLLRPGGRVLAIDSLWAQEQPTTAAPRPHRGYTTELADRLPVQRATSVDEVVAIARAGGFVDAHAVMLEEITAIERDLHPPGDRPFSTRYVIIGTRRD